MYLTVTGIGSPRSYLGLAYGAYMSSLKLLVSGARYATDALDIEKEKQEQARLWCDVVRSAYCRFDQVEVMDTLSALGLGQDGIPHRQIKGPDKK